MRLWIDDVRPAPDGYVWVKSVNEAKIHCCQMLKPDYVLNIEIISLDHDAGNYNYSGGDYIKLLEWLEEKYRLDGWLIETNFHIHSMNPIGVQNMRAIIERNGWKEIR